MSLLKAMLLLLLVVVGASSALSLPHLFRGEDAAAKTETLVPSATYDSKVCQWFDNGVYSCVEQEGCLRARVDLEGNPVCRLSEKRNRAWSSTDGWSEARRERGNFSSETFSSVYKISNSSLLIVYVPVIPKFCFN